MPWISVRIETDCQHADALTDAAADASVRTLRFADGPDEVHRNAIAKLELGKYAAHPREVEMPITRGC